jgi:hypothetical protein
MVGPPVYRPEVRSPKQQGVGPLRRPGIVTPLGAVQRMPSGAPPVYRPASAISPMLAPRTAPAVYRPSAGGIGFVPPVGLIQTPRTVQRGMPGVPPIYRPGPNSSAIQCDGIGFQGWSHRVQPQEIAVGDLKDHQLETVDANPDNPSIVYFPPLKKDALVMTVRDRIASIKEAKLKKISDGGKGYHTHSDRYVVVPYPRPSTPERSQLETNYSSLPFKIVEPRSPVDYDSYPPEVVHTPGGSNANRSGAYGGESPGRHFHGFAIYAPNFPDLLPLYTPGTPTPLGKTPIPCVGILKDSGWQSIDEQRLKRWAGERQGYKPSSSMASGESSGQNGAMGNISASEAAADSGYNSGEWEWLHLIAFTLGGIGQTTINHPDNLVAGTVGANRVHKVIEDTIKKLLMNKITYEVHVRARAHIKPNSYHLCTKLEYGLNFKMQMIGEGHNYYFEIDTLNPNPAQGGNMYILVQSLSGLPSVDGSKGTFFA